MSEKYRSKHDILHNKAYKKLESATKELEALGLLSRLWGEVSLHKTATVSDALANDLSHFFKAFLVD